MASSMQLFTVIPEWYSPYQGEASRPVQPWPGSWSCNLLPNRYYSDRRCL